MTATHSPWRSRRWLALQRKLHKAPNHLSCQARPEVRGTHVTSAHSRMLAWLCPPGTHTSLTPWSPPPLQDTALFAGHPDLSCTLAFVPALCLHPPLLSPVQGPGPAPRGKGGLTVLERSGCHPHMTPRPTHKFIQRPTRRQTHTNTHTHIASCLRSTHSVTGVAATVVVSGVLSNHTATGPTGSNL